MLNGLLVDLGWSTLPRSSRVFPTTESFAGVASAVAVVYRGVRERFSS